MNEEFFSGTCIDENHVSVYYNGTFSDSMDAFFYGVCISRNNNIEYNFNGSLYLNGTANGIMKYTDISSYSFQSFAEYKGEMRNFKREGKGTIIFNMYNTLVGTLN